MKTGSREGAKTRNGERRLTRRRGGAEDAGLNALLATLGGLIREARQHALRAVDLVQVRTCWEVGRHIVEFEQGGAARAEYGTSLLARIAGAIDVAIREGIRRVELCATCGSFYRDLPDS